jgi:hypothetical protein
VIENLLKFTDILLSERCQVPLRPLAKKDIELPQTALVRSIKATTLTRL